MDYIGFSCDWSDTANHTNYTFHFGFTWLLFMLLSSENVFRLIYLAIGCISLILGIIGAFVPIMPTVPFLIVALWGFSKSSERFHNWLYTHKIYGPMLQDWDKYRVIPIWGKIWAVAAMSGSLVIMIYLKLPIWAVLIAGIIMTSVGIFIVSCPHKKPSSVD